MSIQDITDKIERLEVMEEKLGISIESLYAAINKSNNKNEYFFELNGEIHPTNGTTIDKTMRIVVSLHDDDGRVVGRKEHWVTPDSFFGLESFSVYITTQIFPCKIRIYPTMF